MKNLIVPLAAIYCTANAFAAEAPSARPLFNGKDLAGWSGSGYVVEDGAIVCTPEGKNLVSAETFANYILEFDFKLPPGGNNGLGIHYPGSGDGAYSGMELQILDNSDPKYKDLKDYQFHGSLYTLAPAKKSGLKPVGEWNHQKVTVSGSGLTVELNGEIILRTNLDDLSARNPKHEGVKRRSGHIALLGHGDKVAFKNIQIAETAPAAYVEGVMAAGFTRLANGKNLDGWKHGNSPDWVVTNGIIKHNGNKDAPDLWTEKEYADCSIVFDWRWSGTGPLMQRPILLPDGTAKLDSQGKPETIEVQELDSGIYLRGSTKSQVNLWNWPVGSGEVYGYRTDASVSPEVRAGVTPKVKADRPLGEWNRTMVTIKGDRLTVSLNGRVVIDNAQLPGVPAKGFLGLQHHGGAIDFANLWVKEL
ncbi:DUF1080 domain-containing protein [Luteolibacter yonseiensis]|uniref:DUF1080 domain-containing protein n=1 Tax=Luteolibacter yonseiensis TaxID=1144680 RepID=A0A934R2F9_9BACT|nr:DUF1080 domain-containing protein [Luteolibacter yonseiensis]MBK1815056.1 DUF1080 domain-containing protein [Luteolibacter yonseiensis]